MFGTMVTNSPRVIFSIIVISQSIDFWVVKNVTGRYLVNMRWWIVSRYNLETMGMDVDEDRDVERILRRVYSEEERDLSEEEEDENPEFYFFFESFDEEVYLSWVNNRLFWLGELISCSFWVFVSVVTGLGLDLMWVR